MRVRFECPLDFISVETFKDAIKNFDLVIDDSDPELIVVNPGTELFLDYKHFSHYKNLKVVATPSTGTNHIDVATLKKMNISVLCLLDDRQTLDNIHASAEFTWLHIMNLVRKFSKALTSVDDWRSKQNEEFLRSNELHSKKIGIIGFGRIGKKIANYANAFGLHIMVYDPYVFEYPSYVEKVSGITSLNNCDIISINCYLTEETRGMITYGTLDQLKQGAIVVNTSRGEVVDEDYILHLIDSKNILFGADVLQNEQNILELKKSKLYNASKTNSNVAITPHVAGATTESQLKAFVSVLKLSKQFIV